MADTWRLDGDGSGVHYVSVKHVESVVAMPMTPLGIWEAGIRTMSGKEYFAYFSTKEERDAFVASWASFTSEPLVLDAEPAPDYA